MPSIRKPLNSALAMLATGLLLGCPAIETDDLGEDTAVPRAGGPFVPGERQKSDSEVDALQRAFARRVHRDLLPEVSRLEEDAIWAMLGHLAAELVVPHRDMLMREGHARLSLLPRFDMSGSGNWQVVRREVGIGERLVREMNRMWPSTQPGRQGVSKEALLLLEYWDPVMTAQCARKSLLAAWTGTDAKASMEFLSRLLNDRARVRAIVSSAI